MSELETKFTTELQPLRRRALAVGALALGLCLIGIFTDRGQFFRSYLIAYMFWLGIPLGCLGIVMIHHLVGGTWGFVIQRSLESAIRTFPIMALLFLPLLFGLPDLFIWARPQTVAQDPVLLQKAAYLNIPAFVIRAAVYFGGWMLLSWFYNRWSAQEDRDGSGHSKMAAISSRFNSAS